MQKTFLDYYKIVLDKVSFDHQLFTKEYRKALRILSVREAEELHRWLDARGLLLWSRNGESYYGQQRQESSAAA